MDPESLMAMQAALKKQCCNTSATADDEECEVCAVLNDIGDTPGSANHPKAFASLRDKCTYL